MAKLQDAIAEWLVRAAETDNQPLQQRLLFQIQLLQRAQENMGRESYMQESVDAIVDAANIAHQLTTNNPHPFEALESCRENCGKVQDEHLRMQREGIGPYDPDRLEGEH